MQREDIDKSIKKYIQNEKDIARYKVSSLERIKNPTASQKRILSIEKEFITLPLENILFEDIPDVAAAISIYRTSRSQFFDIYKVKNIDSQSGIKQDLTNLLNKKFSFAKKAANELMIDRPQEVNVVQNYDLYHELVRKQASKSGNSFDVEKKLLDSKNIKYLSKIEPVSISKKRARIQVALYSTGKFLLSNIPKIDEATSSEIISDFIIRLDELIVNLYKNIFCYYDDSIIELPQVLIKTMGENMYIEKLYRLQNVLDFSNLENASYAFPVSNHQDFSKEVPMVGNLFFGSKKVISSTFTKDAERNIQNKVFGILLPIKREGNEKMTLLHKKIIINDEDVSEMFSEDLSNVKARNEAGEVTYYKALLMKPVWMLVDLARKNICYRHTLCCLTGLDQVSFENINFDDKDIISKINNKHSGFINISSSSRILTTKTRSEDEGISEVIGIINSKLTEIKEEYNLLKI